MKKIVFFLLIIVSVKSNAESFTCSYPAYFGKKIVILKIKLSGNSAKVDDDDFIISQNNDLGIVLVRSFSRFNKLTKEDDIGLFGITINKKTLNFTRGHIADTDKTTNVASGSCVKD